MKGRGGSNFPFKTKYVRELALNADIASFPCCNIYFTDICTLNFHYQTKNLMFGDESQYIKVGNDITKAMVTLLTANAV